jgi:hypothetical protein
VDRYLPCATCAYLPVQPLSAALCALCALCVETGWGAKLTRVRSNETRSEDHPSSFALGYGGQDIQWRKRRAEIARGGRVVFLS